MNHENPFLDKAGTSIFGEPKGEASAMEEVEIDGEQVLCRRIDMLAEYGEALKSAEQYQKTAVVEARQATERETVSTSQDGTQNVAEPGDWIIHNPGDKDPYVFGDKEREGPDGTKIPVSVEERQQAFAKKYDALPNTPGQFQSKGVVRALRIKENIVFMTSYGETMAAKAGDWVTDGGWSIRDESFQNTYKKIN